MGEHNRKPFLAFLIPSSINQYEDINISSVLCISVLFQIMGQVTKQDP